MHEPQRFIGNPTPTYFRFFLVDPSEAAEFLKQELRREREALDPYPQFVDQFHLVFYVDIDTETGQFYMPYEVGLTRHAACFDVPMGETVRCFAAVDAACAAIAPVAQKKLRIGLARFALQEYDDMRRLSLFTKRMFYRMGSEWILFKNICRRAGSFGWFWRAWDRWYDKHDG